MYEYILTLIIYKQYKIKNYHFQKVKLYLMVKIKVSIDYNSSSLN